MADNERPEGLETKDTRGTLLGYTPAEVPHVSRTAGELSDREREQASLAAGTPHAGRFDDKVAPMVLGEPSDSDHARRVGEGRYPAEGPAAPQESAGPAPSNEQPATAVPTRRASGGAGGSAR
jgi:hypothetical protein